MYPVIVILLCCVIVRIQSCGYPGSPAHASVSFTTEVIQPSTVATYTCDNGYELLGPPRKTCASNGTWVPQGVPFCVLNVGVGKAAMQSSTVGQASPQKAVDGSTSNFYTPNTCTMTEMERSPWWYVNLLEPYLVQLVRIDFGSSCCANNRPALVTVRVGNNRPDLGVNPICNKFTGFIEEGRPLFLPCTRPTPGAFVSVHLESNGNPLSICEAFVYTDHALSIEQCPSFRDQPLGSTSTYNGKCYIFYNNLPMNFDSAKRFCEIRGGSLVDETSPALQGFLSWELYRRHRSDPNGQYWLGAQRDQNSPSNWKWINGKDVTISFWNLNMGNENCSRFDGSRGWLWSDTNCKSKLNMVCQHRPLTCGKPERPTNSTILARTVDIGSIIEYRCSSGSLLVGPSIRTCLSSGFFSEFSPKCKYLECGFPASISDGEYTLVNDSRSYMSGVQYSCKTGYILVGRAYLICDVDERWNGPPPRCEPILCPSAPITPNSQIKLSNNSTVFGTRATYSCLPGYELVGDQYLVCSSSGYWEGQAPYCKGKRSTTTTTQTPHVTSTTTRRITTRRYTSRPFLNSNPKTRQPPQIALLPIESTTVRSTSKDSYSRFTINRRPTSAYSTSSPTITRIAHTKPTTTIISSTATTRKPIIVTKGHDLDRDSLDESYENDIEGSSLSRANQATTKLNMGGIIALGVFGGFVFLAAIITIIIIIVRRFKNSRNIDAQTISTFDSSGDQSGFYRNYKESWENLKYARHPSYKIGRDLDGYRKGLCNEGYRDNNEITLNADVAALYTRPDKRHGWHSIRKY